MSKENKKIKFNMKINQPNNDKSLGNQRKFMKKRKKNMNNNKKEYKTKQKSKSKSRKNKMRPM